MACDVSAGTEEPSGIWLMVESVDETCDACAELAR